MDGRDHVRLSASQLQAYLACPLKYRFQYIDRIERPWRAAALAFGTSVHRAVEFFHTERMQMRSPGVDDVVRAFEEDWKRQNAEALVFSEREPKDALLEKGRTMVRLYAEENASTPVPAGVEQPFEVELFDPATGEAIDVAFRGYIDLVEEDGTVADLKTAGRSLESGGLERHLQLSCYALARLIETGEIPSLRLDMLMKTARPRFERLTTTRSIADLSWTAQLIREVALAILTEHFFPNPSWRCNECEYFAHCQRWRGYEPPRGSTLVSIEEGVGGQVA